MTITNNIKCLFIAFMLMTISAYVDAQSTLIKNVVIVENASFKQATAQDILIENGKISYPVKGATFTGAGDEVLKKISMVANDLKLDSGVGVCGKDGQSVPVGVGQPSLKIDELIVGGTEC